MKIKEFKKIGMYLDLARELKRQWNMRVTVIPIVTRAPLNTWGKNWRNWKLKKESRPS